MSVLAGAVVALGLLLYGALVFRTNRAAATKRSPLAVERSGDLPAAGPRLEVVSWNLGYAAIGQDAVFQENLGRLVWPPSRRVVRRNLARIKSALSNLKVDVYALQEVVVTSPLTWWLNIWREIAVVKSGADRTLALDVTTRLVPPPLVLAHGAGTLSSVRIERAETVPLPLETEFWLGCLRKHYTLLVSWIPMAGTNRQWVVINIHLAAHDHGAATRRKQLEAALAFAIGEYEKGHHVIIAGDWNLVLGGTELPHTTQTRYLDWVRPFPRETLPEAWQLVFDPKAPTVRTSEKPYKRFENFAAIIDGFVVSPNVEVADVKTIDLEFESSDHHPVIGAFTTRK